jgi:hypothetical protein
MASQPGSIERLQSGQFMLPILLWSREAIRHLSKAKRDAAGGVGHGRIALGVDLPTGVFGDLSM